MGKNEEKKTRFQFGHLCFLLERIWQVFIFSSRCGNNSIIRRWRLIQFWFVTKFSTGKICSSILILLIF